MARPIYTTRSGRAESARWTTSVQTGVRSVRTGLIRNPLDWSGISYSFAAKTDADQWFLRRPFLRIAKRSPGNRITSLRGKSAKKKRPARSRFPIAAVVKNYFFLPSAP
jgi:hypothetical protein